jgi:hypothetical protein
VGYVVAMTNPYFTDLIHIIKERSLTTILYLMSLTEEARSPFSLVDEINQVHFFIRRFRSQC